MSEAIGQKMVADLWPKFVEAQQAINETKEKLKKWENLWHRLSTAVATLEWNMQQMLEKGKIDAKLNEKVLREILNTPGWKQMLEQLVGMGREIEDLQGTLYYKDKMDITKPGLLGDAYKAFLNKIPSFLATQQQASEPKQQPKQTEAEAEKKLKRMVWGTMFSGEAKGDD